MRAPTPLSKARAAASDPAVLNRYFDFLEDVLVKNDLLGEACQILNMDETQITVVACVSAAGSFMPPMVTLDCKTLLPQFTDGEVPETAYGMSARG